MEAEFKPWSVISRYITKINQIFICDQQRIYLHMIETNTKSNFITVYNFIIRSMMGLNGLGLWLINSLYSVKKMSRRSILMV
jgi:hypothetical protein